MAGILCRIFSLFFSFLEALIGLEAWRDRDNSDFERVGQAANKILDLKSVNSILIKSECT